ncbi:hypothetical protein C8F04DRAFT_1182844 [Mycena alexandri]|uniref:Uncharacterized protein n=1 Tax=Mycena alexandri TaxID=1745969 RepID=A0AAD6SVY9_9AGAR|nr:hypothetical protein C8F04DRAFT_1182844 [Mycena alexandri]
MPVRRFPVEACPKTFSGAGARLWEHHRKQGTDSGRLGLVSKKIPRSRDISDIARGRVAARSCDVLYTLRRGQAIGVTTRTRHVHNGGGAVEERRRWAIHTVIRRVAGRKITSSFGVLHDERIIAQRNQFRSGTSQTPAYVVGKGPKESRLGLRRQVAQITNHSSTHGALPVLLKLLRPLLAFERLKGVEHRSSGTHFALGWAHHDVISSPPNL